MARLLVALLAACATAAVVAVGIATHGDDGKPSAQQPPSETPSPTAPARTPRAGDCHRLTFSGAAAATDSSAPVSCRSAHTAVTIYVGRLPVADGQLLAADSTEVQQQLATRCPRRLAPYVGGSETGRRLSRFSVVWFAPTDTEAKAGARWFRCDLVALAGGDRLAPLSRRMHRVLDRPHALARWGTCGTKAPDAAHFERVLCGRAHRWRATDVVTLPKHARYLGKAAAAGANDKCQAVAADHAAGALKYTWSFEWPTRAQWTDGRRYGFCWLPTT